MKSIFLKLFFVIIIIFSYFYFDVFGTSSPADRLSSSQVIKTGGLLGEKYDMKICFMGGGETKDRKVRLVTVGFERKGKPLTLEEGRKIIVESTQTYLLDINNNEKLKPYLSKTPFTEENLNITIINLDEKGKFTLDPFLATISQLEGKVYYRTQDPENEYKFKSEISETYNEAVAILLKKERENANVNLELPP